jgi:hypothetical protein
MRPRKDKIERIPTSPERNPLEPSVAALLNADGAQGNLRAVSCSGVRELSQVNAAR